MCFSSHVFLVLVLTTFERHYFEKISSWFEAASPTDKEDHADLNPMEKQCLFKFHQIPSR